MTAPHEASTPTYWWRKVNNVGDAINPVLLERIFGLRPSWTDAPGKVLACAGSIVSHAKTGWIIWGSGLISADCPIPSGLTVLAVRGPLTRKRLIDAGYTLGEIYGDPGLLMPLVGGGSSGDIRHEWGIVPHFTEFDHPAIAPFTTVSRKDKLLGKIRGRKVICINPMAPVEQYLKQLRRCRAIASSSLHGLILAEAYGKPAVWLQLAPDATTATRLMGGDFKFIDFYRGVGKEVPTPVVLESGIDFEALDSHAQRWQPMNWSPLPLLNSFPDRLTQVREVCQSAEQYFSNLAHLVARN
jgi:hypothetical protein